MGLNLSRYTNGSDGQHLNGRPGSKPSNIFKKIFLDIGIDQEVPMMDNTAGSNTDMSHPPGSSRQQIKDEARGSLEIGERTVNPTSRIILRTRQVNMAPLRRLCLIRTDERPELRQSQQMVEVEEVNSQSVLIGNETRTTQGEAEETTSQSMSNYVSIQDEENLGLAQGYERGEAIDGEERRNATRQFLDTLVVHDASLQQNSYQNFRENIEPILLLYHSRARLSNRRVGARNPLHEESERYRNRNLSIEERRRRFRSQMWTLQRLNAHLERLPSHVRPDLSSQVQHGHGHMMDSPRQHGDPNTRASISRILMLAEALFQVLEDIHRQSVSISRLNGLSLGYLPAPGAVVESIPSRLFEKVENSEDSPPQCHVCLMEYEDGDRMRVLPCGHEYHMICIDKWLKEVHRICPLCRRDVCELKANDSEGST